MRWNVRLWLAEYARPAPQRSYRYALQRFAAEFDRRRLGDFDRLTARAWANVHPQSNVRVVRAMFNVAINDGFHPGPNPFANLRLEQSRGRKDLVAVTEDELLPKNGKQRVVILPPPARDALLEVPPRTDTRWLFVTERGRQVRKSSLLYYWNPVRAAYGRPGMDVYELRHFCATHLLELGVSHADVAVQLGHTDAGALVMSTYGHPSEDGARATQARLRASVVPLQPRLRAAGEQTGGTA